MIIISPPSFRAAVVLVVSVFHCSPAWKTTQQVAAFVFLHSLPPTISRSTNFRAKSGIYTSQRPLEEILLELEAKGILFSPAATKSDLEELLLSSNNYDGTIPRTDGENSPSIRRRDSFDEKQTSILNAQEPPRRRLSDLKSSEQRRVRSEWPEMAFRYDPEDEFRNAREIRRRRRQRRQKGRQLSFPEDALFRVVNKTSKTVARVIPEQALDIGSKAARLARRKTQQFFNELVDLTYEDLDAPKTVRYRSSSSDTRRRRRHLEDKEGVSTERRARRKEPNGGETTSSPSKDYRVEREAETAINETKSRISGETRTIPIREILSQLDEMNVRYSAEATREELQNLLNHAKRFHDEQSWKTGTEATKIVMEPENDDSEVTATTSTSSDETGFSLDREYFEDGILSRTSRVASTTVKTVPKKLDNMRKRARKIYGKTQASVTGLFQDTSLDTGSSENAPIIVDAVVEDFSKTRWDDGLIDVRPTYRESWSTVRPKAQSSQRSDWSAQSRGPGDNLGSKWRRRSVNMNSRRVVNFSKPKGRQNKVTPADIKRLGPSKDASSYQGDDAEPRTRSGKGPSRRIYSPYYNNEVDESVVYVDGLDKFGSFFASSLDSFLWGREDETTPTSPSSSSNRQKPPSEEIGRRKRSGHWKDRMEEQFDFLLGIHQDGQYYNRWVQQEIEDSQNVEGTDAVAYARGRAPRPGSKRRISERPIWEEKDSLLSMLFGTDKKAQYRNEMFYRPTSFFGSGSLVKILQTMLRSCMLLAGGVSRWASVRGSVPQAVVVIGILSTFLSSRPGSRIRNVFLALLATRVAGELLHGYLYDESDFWDPKEDGRNEEVPEKV